MTRPLRVLLVEDSKVLADRLAESLRELPEVEWIGTVDGENRAVDLARRESADVLILDLHLRQGTGFGVMRALNTAQSDIRVIVLTNYDLPEYKNAALSLGAAHFLDKARDFSRLPELLHAIYEGAPATH